MEKLAKPIGIIYILISIAMFYNGTFHANQNIPDQFNLYWMATGGAFLIGMLSLFFSKGLLTSTYISRILVGSLFIVSGLIKANDTLGFSFKLEEYFAEPALNWPIFSPYSLPLSIFIAASEIVLGFAVLFGALIRLSSWALLGMILFFAWLTYFTASCNDAQILALEQGVEFHGDCVTDCGCFGDALKGSVGRSLTPWESFFKDITLLIFTIPIVLMQGKIKFNTLKDDKIILPSAIIFTIIVGAWLFGWWFPTIFTAIIFALYLFIKQNLVRESQVLPSAFITILASFGFALYTIHYLPIKDYRPYAISNNILEKMSDGKDGIYNDLMVYENKKTAEILEIDQKEYMKRWKEIEANYNFKDRVQRVVVEGVSNSISDFKPYKFYDNLNKNELENEALKASIAKVYDDYYQKVHVLQNIQYGYTDSVLEIDYDKSLYPLSDSTWAYKGLVEAKLDPNKQMEVDFTSYLLHLDKVSLFISYDLDLTNKEAWLTLKQIADNARSKGIKVYAITNGLPDMTNKLNKEIGANIDFLTMDATELKILVRSNPGVLYLENGTVKQKWDFNRLDHLSLKD